MMAKAKSNLSVVLYAKDDLRLENRQYPKPKAHEAVLRMECVGICGSDVSFWKKGRIATCIVESAVVIGHEGSGTVVEVGSEVRHLKPGDRVAIEPGVACKTCQFCKQGDYNECGGMIFCACPPVDGNLSEFYCQSAYDLYKLPDHVTLEEGALMEPFAVAIHACKRGNITANSTVLILGAGPIGLTTLLAAKAYGATKIIITDLVDFRLDTARKLGADFGVKINPNDDEQSTVNKILGTFGEEPEVCVDCTGLESCVRMGILAAKKKGVMVLVGMQAADMNLPMFEAQCKEVDIRGCFRYCNDYPTALGLVASGKVDLKPLITHHFKLKDSLEAFETSATGKGNAIKVMIHPNSSWKN